MVCMRKKHTTSKNDQMNHEGAQNELNAPLCQGARGALGVKIQVSPNKKTSLTKVVRYDNGMIKNSSAPSGGARKTRKAGFLVS